MSGLESATAKVSLDEKDDVLKETTNINTEIEPPSEVAGFNPQAKGWVKPTRYDYEIYNRNAYTTGPEGAAEANRVTPGNEMGLWAANAERYEWKEEYGDVAPCNTDLEKMLFQNEFRTRLGPSILNLALPAKITSLETVAPIKGFESAGLHPVMLENIKLCGYTKPTSIQAYSIPAIITGHDLIAVAQTGSGKTAAFLIPTISKLMGKAKKLAGPRPDASAPFDIRINGVTAEPLVLVIVPTRELAIQIFDEARRLCYRSMLRPCVAYGGGPSRDQQRELARGCDILVGTPGRLIDFMGRGKTLSLRRVKYTVIDEADDMVSSDWSDALTQLLSGGDNNQDADHRYLMFSATFPKATQELAAKHLDDSHIRVKVGRAGSTHKNIYQHFVYASSDRKRDCIRDLMRTFDPVRTIIFVNGKHSADEVDDYLYNQGFPTTSIHSDRTQREREDALHGFRTGTTPILVTTGVSARGLDIYDVGHVINYDLPKVNHGGIDEYIHRIGRTARIGHIGISTSFYSDEDEAIASDIVKLLIETEQEVPDFLEGFKPQEGEGLRFDDDDGDDGKVITANKSTGTVGKGWEEDTKTSGGTAWNPEAAAISDDATTVEDKW